MNKIIPIIILLVFSILFGNLKAQEVKEHIYKNYFLGGAINYTLTENSGNNSLNFPSLGDSEFITSAIHIGRRFAKNSALGFRGSLIRSTSPFILFDFSGNPIDEVAATSNSLSVGIFYRQYITIKNDLFIILEPNVSYFYSESNRVTISNMSSEGINLGFDIIPQCRISNRWNLFVNLGGVNFNSGENIIDIEGIDNQIENSNTFSFDFQLRDVLLGAEWLF